MTKQEIESAPGEIIENAHLRDETVELTFNAARSGGPVGVAALRNLLKLRPDLWPRCGDLAARVLETWIALAAARDDFLREAVHRKAQEMRTELAGPNASLLEKLLADRIVACWIQLHHADGLCAQASDDAKPDKSEPYQEEATKADRAEQNRRRDGLGLERRQSAAQTRYLQAIRQLALVRKLLRPTPSALDLLKYPVNEGDAGAGAHTGTRRAGLGVQGVEN